jgi:hypothetical protein
VNSGQNGIPGTRSDEPLTLGFERTPYAFCVYVSSSFIATGDFSHLAGAPFVLSCVLTRLILMPWTPIMTKDEVLLKTLE